MWGGEDVLFTPRMAGPEERGPLTFGDGRGSEGCGAGALSLQTPSPPSPRPAAGQAEVSEEGGAEEAEGAAGGRRAGAELRASLGRPPFMVVISAPV